MVSKQPQQPGAMVLWGPDEVVGDDDSDDVGIAEHVSHAVESLSRK